jgi:SpoIID/LytB domain protein
LSIGIVRSRPEAEKIVAYAAKLGLESEIIVHALPVNWRLPFMHKAIYQVFIREVFSSEQSAAQYQEAIRPRINSELTFWPFTPARGRLRFTHLKTGKRYTADNEVKLNLNKVQFLDVQYGGGYHWQSHESRIHDGILEFFIDLQGLVSVVNELSLEAYIKGVVPSEMPPGFPVEALKAQAITARGKAVARIGIRHIQEPFDLCGDVHCQVFAGLSKRQKSSDVAVESTKGIFMIYRSRLADAFYGGVCGGHTESNENIWLMNPEPYLRGRLDAGLAKAVALQDESDARRWIDNNADVYCNTVTGIAPGFLNYTKKYFRWQLRRSRSELEKNIKEQTGEQFGRLVDFKVVSRGRSGRVLRLRVIGTARSFDLDRELLIRQSLAASTLYSSCFYIDRLSDVDSFVIKGAGWGHGVGMCQTGAAMMAFRGKKFDQILTHYYQGIFLKKLYN